MADGQSTYAPQALLDWRAYLKPYTGLVDSALGIVGDENHNGGYHHGWDLRSSDSDYSWDESSRDWNHKTNAASAGDIGMFARLRELSVWLVGECAGGAPDTADIREIIYSPDGKTVKRWDRQGVRSSGDDSHLTHTHISWFRDAEQRDKTAVFRRFFEGDDMADYGDLGHPTNLAPYNYDHPDTMLADLFAAFVTGTTGWGSKSGGAAGWEIYKRLAEIESKLDKLLSGGGGPVATKVDLTDEALDKVEERVDRQLDQVSLADDDTAPARS